MKVFPLSALAALLLLAGGALAADAPAPASPAFDEALAEALGADDYAMRQYVLVIDDGALVFTRPDGERIPDVPRRSC